MKKLFLSLLVIALSFFSLLAWPVQAAVPTLQLATTGDGDKVQLTVAGDKNANVILVFTKASGASYLQYLGTTNASGSYSNIVSTAELNIMPNSSVQVKVADQQSSAVAWPYDTSTGGGAITLSKTGLILTVGNSTSLTVNNVGSNKLYLLNNSNPQIANVNLSSNQVTVYANTYGQTVATVCVLGTTSNCASTYITVQNSGAKELTLSQSNLTIAYGQSSQVSILNSSGNYTILNNSNPSVITASIKDQTITLTASNNGGTAAITICSSDMSACGIINASVGTITSSSLTFSQAAPTLSIGQTLTITVSGGGSSYNISSNSNSSVLSASLNNSTLTLVGGSAGTSVVTVCSSTGNCNSLTATVSYASSGGPITLSQANLWLQIGQAVSVVISGGSAPYSFVNDANSATLFQTALNNNILTLTGVKAGSASVSVCSSGGACTQLSVLVNGVSSNTQLTFGSNNLSLKVGSTSDVSLYGSGGYYISNSTNQNVATIVISGNKAVVTALAAGNANATVCQTGGQCGVIYAAVTATDTNTPISFSRSNPTLSVGQSSVVAISGGSGSGYSISSNANPAVIQANLSGNSLALVGKANGSAVITVCAATNNCGSLAVTVGNAGNAENNNDSDTAGTVSNDIIIQLIAIESQYLADGNAEIIIANAKATRSTIAETAAFAKYVSPLTKKFSLSATSANTLNYFIWYGTPSTRKLGAGERAGVINSYWQAYSKLPVISAQWSDLIKIGLGRWPSESNVATENQAKLEFKKVYGRVAVMSDSKDASAIKIIAYGLRPALRNAASEKVAIKSFRYVYNHDPISPLAWNIVRAVAYSGVSR